ncbi:MAG: hypothetical protein U1E39_14100 [Planctomycetota bacterium]
MSRVVTRSRVVTVAGLFALTALAFSTVSRADGDDPSVGAGSGTGLGARVAGPVLPGVAPRFVDSGVEGRVLGAVNRTPVEGRLSRTSLAVPTSLGTPTTEQAVPYRVEPRDANGNPPNAWDLPPEEPDPRDFERAETFDAIASPHYEIREEIWNNPEDLVTNTGLSRYGGVAYVPFWGRNTLRWGRLSVFPFAHIEGVWHSNLGQGDTSDGEQVFEIMASVGALGEYWASGGKTKIKAALRADYHWYDTLYDDAVTYVGGASVETKLSAYHTIEVGGEVERARRAFDLDTTGGAEENMFDRESVFVNGRWDRFLSNDLRLEAGASYSWIDEIDSDVNGGDYEELDAFARLGWAIMRHESFAYLEGRYEERNASQSSDASDLDHAYEVRVGVNGIQPHARTRRVVGNIYAGWRTETYTPSDNPGSLGRGQDTEADLLTLGADLTYRPTAYTSGYLSFQRTNTFSAVSNYNTVDSLTLAVTQNLSRRVVGRLAVSGSRIEPQDRSESWRVSAGAGIRWVLSDNVDATADYEYMHRFEGGGYDEADAQRVAVGLTFHLR